jgi:REP element-mobilizing transposase RayT
MSKHDNVAIAGRPLAYLITVTTYGTWLPGDPRGWNVQRPKRPPIGARGPSPQLEASTQSRMKGDAVLLTKEMRLVVERVIRLACETAGWSLISVAVRSNHFHVLVAAGATAAQVLSRVKGCATRGLRRSGYLEDAGRIWTRQGSTRYLWSKKSVIQAQYYVEVIQDDPTLTMPWSAS